MSDNKRQMKMVGFPPGAELLERAGSWRHPANAMDFLTAEYYQRIARVLEEGKFDMAFFDDRLAMPDIYGDDHRETRRQRHARRQDGSRPRD